MTNEERRDPSYAEDDQGVRLERIWGEGFMSLGGPEEVSRILGKNKIDGLEVLDIGCGIGGADLVLVQEHRAGRVMGIAPGKRLARSRRRDRLTDIGKVD